MNPIVLAIVVLLATGLILGLVIGLAVKLFAVQQDPRLEEVEALLPNANCGACGFAGCSDFARALLSETAETGQCPSSSEENIGRIAALLGVEAGARAAKVALVRCGGDDERAVKAAAYNGVNDCRSASLVAGGAKGCRHGCLGLASCARACPFNAIEITPQRLAVVHPDVCTGCGKCVATCPRRLIVLAPANAPLHVLCNSPEKGAVCNKVCKVSCIGCRKCLKKAGDGQMTMDGFVARVNYDDPPSGELADVCPTQCLRATGAAAAAAETAKEVEPEVANA